MSIKFGIMQGRLTKTKKNVLQKFPKNWKKEFDYLENTYLDYLEFFTEQKINKKNPIWSDKGIQQIKKKITKTKYKKLILCDNFSVVNSIIEKKNENYLFNLINRLSFFKNSKLIIPVIYKKIFSEKIFNRYIISIKKLIDYSTTNKVDISFEFHADIKIIKRICKKFSKNKNFSITYDTGNAFLFNKNFYNEIKTLKKYVNHIHLKDRDIFGNNVILGEGKIKFNLFLNNLNKFKRYNGTITFETNRGVDPINTANLNYWIIKNLLF